MSLNPSLNPGSSQGGKEKTPSHLFITAMLDSAKKKLLFVCLMFYIVMFVLSQLCHLFHILKNSKNDFLLNKANLT